MHWWLNVWDRKFLKVWEPYLGNCYRCLRKLFGGQYPPIQTLEDSINFYGLEFEPHGMSNQGPARWLTPRNSWFHIQKKKQTSSPKILEVILKTQGSPAIENTIMVRHYSYCLLPKGSSRILFNFVSQIYFFKVMNNYDAFFSQKESYQPWSVDRMTLARPKEKQNVAYHLRNSQMLKKEMLYSATP